ncbi:MAG: cyclic pyranopterin monophosphate synthase MoaC [Geminocystis sp.]|nr:cyclic pyranopterin monophosphate synthase MoaC [Geminocystis sp.]MDW8115126.1 cyclic pyranopterin monophosphate synthase MoaC [Geminocystis sp.]MDW8464394.1 cyclic pyranopterin monophosphate synthase MoaC [Geminocystis sp.]
MLSNINDNQQPQMVDISDKPVSERRAVAEAIVELPPVFRTYLQQGELSLKKGPVLQTAIIAGTMAVKRTADAIPFCHPLPVTSCQFHTEIQTLEDKLQIRLQCEVKTRHNTGVEMESLHGVTIAALTVYDMCKSVSPHIVIRDVRLLAKSGGKKTLGQYPLYGLVLTGGKSQRMGKDKALLDYYGQPHAQYLYNLLSGYCERVFLSARPQQWQGTPLAELPTLVDELPSEGPITGILTALRAYPHVNWWVVACDLPYLNEENLAPLFRQYREDVVATCYHHPQDGFPEPLCAIYTPKALAVFEAAYQEGLRCPVKILQQVPCHRISPPHPTTTANINTPEEYTQALHYVRSQCR